MNALLKTATKIIPMEKISPFHSLLFWIALIELLIIIFLIYKLKSTKKIDELTDLELKNIKDSKNNTIDMDNLMNSIHNSRTLYKELIKKCHPDRFINDNKQKNAEEIFQEITKNERNYEKLSSLKLRAENELNINF
jgi:hypothetical protein